MTSLNYKFIKSIPVPENKHKIYWVDRVTGFGIIITNNNALSFILDYVINKRRRRYTIEDTHLSTTAARKIHKTVTGKHERCTSFLEFH